MHIKTSSKLTMAVVAGVLMLAMLVGVGMAPQPNAMAAPLAAPTPVSVTRPSGNQFTTFEMFATRVITADTTSSCFDVGPYALVDVQYTIDQTDINTVTLTTKWSVDGSTLTSGVNVVASNADDASDMMQAQTFGRYFCLLADVTNSNPVTVTAKTFAK